MRTFWPRQSAERVKFIYLTSDLAAVSEIRRAVGAAFAMRGATTSIDGALRLAAMTGTRVLLTETNLPDGTWRDVITACRKSTPSPAVVVILDDFEGSQWVEMIRASAYDVVLRPLRSEPLQGALYRASRSAPSDKAMVWPEHLP